MKASLWSPLQAGGEVEGPDTLLELEDMLDLPPLWPGLTGADMEGDRQNLIVMLWNDLKVYLSKGAQVHKASESGWVQDWP